MRRGVPRTVTGLSWPKTCGAGASGSVRVVPCDWALAAGIESAAKSKNEERDRGRCRRQWITIFRHAKSRPLSRMKKASCLPRRQRAVQLSEVDLHVIEVVLGIFENQ